jgi:hypothetical protein
MDNEKEPNKPEKQDVTIVIDKPMEVVITQQEEK